MFKVGDKVLVTFEGVVERVDDHDYELPYKIRPTTTSNIATGWWPSNTVEKAPSTPANDEPGTIRQDNVSGARYVKSVYAWHLLTPENPDSQIRRSDFEMQNSVVVD